MCACAYVRAYMYACVCASVRACVYVHVCVCMLVCVYVSLFVCVYASSPSCCLELDPALFAVVSMVHRWLAAVPVTSIPIHAKERPVMLRSRRDSSGLLRE